MAKSFFYFAIHIFCVFFLISCDGSSIPDVRPSSCKVSAVNYGLLSYNSFNQVEKIDLPNASTTRFEYGFNGEIMSKNVFSNNILVAYTSYTWNNTKNAVQISKFEKIQNFFQETQRDSFFLDNEKRITKIKKSNTSYKRFEYENDNVVRVYYYSGLQPEYLYVRFNSFDSSFNPYYNTPLRMLMFDDTGDGFHFSKNNATKCTYYKPNNTTDFTSFLSSTFDSRNNITKLESSTGQFYYFSYICN